MKTTTQTRSPRTRIEIVLWIIQGLLAALFLFAGSTKLLMAGAVLAQQSPLPVGFLRFIGTAETLGALGLILPGALRIHRELTALAAAGLTIIMVGAVVLTIQAAGVVAAMVPFLTGVACVFVAYQRRTRRVSPRALVVHPQA